MLVITVGWLTVDMAFILSQADLAIVLMHGVCQTLEHGKNKTHGQYKRVQPYSKLSTHSKPNVRIIFFYPDGCLSL